MIMQTYPLHRCDAAGPTYRGILMVRRTACRASPNPWKHELMLRHVQYIRMQ